MKFKNIKNKTLNELNGILYMLLYEKFSLRIKLGNNQLKKTHLLKENRRDIARIKTLIINKRVCK
ncbi:50S ribosomal protein L29 [Enterobacteriaceae bacterium ET-AT1-13]|nr:50S ribosomal protein L29 [Enterobacteriaceae bacterium ET-AT1-13]WGS66336.1 50S ribosomal protein L29 [Enterobacteriaceae bacterium Cmel17]WMC17359.1 MAG: 50S ribosomal protein L29 [Enterobacteriaceae bacterium Cmel21]WMC17566.1 MAG: 50S ribosomal protein L29 [Enterobacteriaceae bacterium PSmelAO3-2]WMC17771.1 MAG: 50S ribosomal protein L29 [Enterobacteriaceae bacterium PSmelAO3-1]WMC17974.1 MAG: 50S ribosomal protein L29 [Enterobacteriaceae bacterium PSmelAO1]